MPLQRAFAPRRPLALTGLGGAAISTLLLAAQPALAQTPVADTPSVYLQAGRARGDTDALTLGATLPWRSFQRELWGSAVTGHWDLYVSRWSYDAVPGRSGHSTLLGVTPVLRLTPDQGRSAFFVEGGIGATYADKRYVTPDREFSTRFNFASHLGAGVRLGAQRQHELLLRVQHVSNAGIKHPNPGNNFVQLRYALHF
ncbi:lipid A 3-O-deacylase [Oryzisolibacter propanilivorax]|uniref:Lipid A deacylase n=1 Tax=Oryzisolibacter propanilivorax TaxID=1527607 RepID=A0A1G9QJ82_9BURK|nr:acyloxyacyl hydrolase [Oryzisolibacter propanilivorax]SDM11104.1 lipid A 3-O-deacylase [Oryzisolibacter propanilivorax]